MLPLKRPTAVLKAACPPAVAVRYDRRVGRVVIVLSSGLELGFSAGCSTIPPWPTCSASKWPR
jgi:hypothetical protein